MQSWAVLALAHALLVAPMPLAAQTGSPVRLPTRAPQLQAPEVRPPVRVPTLADAPAPPLRTMLEEDPYAPLGLRLGGIVLRPAIDQQIGYDTNPERTERARGALLSRTLGEVLIDGDWPRHTLNGFLRGSYDAYSRVPDADRPQGEGRLSLGLEVSRDTIVELESRFRLDTQRPGSPEIDAAVRGRPLVTDFGGSAGVTQRFGPLSLGLRGSLDRTIYQDARLTTGATLDQSDRDVTQAALRVRVGYEVHPGLIPFVEAGADRRIYDHRDAATPRRDSTGRAVRAGSTFEITRTLTGEVSAGHETRDYADPRLAHLRGPVADAALAWSATPVTTLRLAAGATLAETTLPGSSGALAQRVTLALRHDLRRNLALTASASLGSLDYDGIRLREETVAGALQLDYRLTRWLALRAGVGHERLRSTVPGADYRATTITGGLRLQR